MSRILKGKPVADALTQEAAARAQALGRKGIVPTLALIRVGERPDDLSYERAALKRCDQASVAVRQFRLPEGCSQQELQEAVRAVNDNDAIHGCLVFRPLAAPLDEAVLARMLDPAKDVDGFTEGSLFAVFAGLSQGFAPCTAEACLRLLDHYGYSPEGKTATVVGRSLVIGRPVAALLQHRHATVTAAHSRTQDLAAACRSADILVAAAGKPALIGAACCHPDQVVVDVGMNWDEESQRMVGDADFDALDHTVEAITPVPGGVGAVTTAVLALHTVIAAERQSASGA